MNMEASNLIAITSLLLTTLVSSCFSNSLPTTNSQNTKQGKILFYMPLNTRSMMMTFMPLAEKLADRGHQVVVLMPQETKTKSENLEFIRVESEFEAFVESVSKDLMKEGSTDSNIINNLLLFKRYADSALEVNDNALKNKRLRELMDRGFDVVLVSPFIASEVGYHVAKRADAALVLYFTVQVSFSAMDWAVGQPHNPSYVPFFMGDFHTPMTFTERIANTVMTFAFHMFRNYYFISGGEALLDKHFPGEERVPLLELEKNTSLVLSYGHPLIMDGLKPLSPNFQYIGMMNCREGNPLPPDLQEFLDTSGDDGVIYVSFGSILKAKEMSETSRRMFVKVFGGLKQKVVWKWETESMPDKPDNLLLSSWLPQQDILAHPKTRLFITHAGQSSFQETLCHKVPVVAIPVEGDQPANAREAVRVGFGKMIMFKDLTEEKLREAILEVIGDPKYAQVAEEHGSLLTDQITRPLDRATWWIEFLIRHRGKNHFRSPVHNLSWPQYFLLDVILVLAIIAILPLILTFKLRKCVCSSKPNEKPHSD